MTSPQSRRQFLSLSSRLAVAQLPLLSACVTQKQDTSLGVGPEAWKELAGHLKGTLIRPGESGFASLAAPWNLRYTSNKKPAGIARCETTEDVRVCLQWAQAHKLPFVARTGGHSYAGYSTTPGLMIELKRMQALSFDPATRVAVVGGGSQNATLYAGLPKTGCSVTHGRCMPVGVASLTLGGGIGFNMRLHGLLIDQLKETEIVTADGKIRRCSKDENKELFWACRGGGGGNFGINTSLTFQTFPVTDLTVFKIAWTSKVEELLPAILDLLPGMPDGLGCKVSLTRRPGVPLTIDLLGQHTGSPAEVRKLFSKLYGLATPSSEEIKPGSYWEGQKFLTEAGVKEHMHERSRYAFRPFSSSACRTILRYMNTWPETHGMVSWKGFLMGGAVAEVPAHKTAYCHRAATILTSVELTWTDKDRKEDIETSQRWLGHFHGEMEQYTSHECYQNFIDDAQEDYLRAYYGSNLGDLVKVKKAVDPGNVFHFRQSIPTHL